MAGWLEVARRLLLLPMLPLPVAKLALFAFHYRNRTVFDACDRLKSDDCQSARNERR